MVPHVSSYFCFAHGSSLIKFDTLTKAMDVTGIIKAKGGIRINEISERKKFNPMSLHAGHNSYTAMINPNFVDCFDATCDGQLVKCKSIFVLVSN